ncbi:hypothetical protein PILCRDRAFT_825073 [Piloderma croceum F 1598]|uniref:Uncharacterized protein n=1 Tax=Piloderma croceum (strain F 1598) TaxID=765440 RepID=A0A0C3AV52_PILCF|nr:hypothetical protein PILCRDRAFT_825073 [Piloderma croceum F 1598]
MTALGTATADNRQITPSTVSNKPDDARLQYDDNLGQILGASLHDFHVQGRVITDLVSCTGA